MITQNDKSTLITAERLPFCTKSKHEMNLCLGIMFDIYET